THVKAVEHMMQSSRHIYITSRIPRRMTALLTFALVLTPWVRAHAQSAASCKIRVVTHDEASKPIPEVLVEVTTADASVVSAKSNQKGETDFVLAPGTYDVTVKKSGFEPMSQKAISVAAGLPIEIVFVLVPTVVLKQSVDVNANSETTIEKSSSTQTQLERVTVKYTT